MKTFALLALLGALLYYHGFSKPAPTVIDTVAQPVANRVASKDIIVAPAPTCRNRWKSGPNAFTDLKTGPNAQVSFEPFLPDEQANWNPNPGYTIVSGPMIRR